MYPCVQCSARAYTVDTSSAEEQDFDLGLILDVPSSRMAVPLCLVRPLLAILLLISLPVLNCVYITDEEADLLAETAQDIFCFSRTFEDLTCFWDEPAHVDGAYRRFFYTYKGDRSRECTLRSAKHSDGGWRHVCIFPRNHQDILLFAELHVEVLDTISNHTTRSQDLSVASVGLIAPPMNVTVVWPGVARQLHVAWTPPPFHYADFLAYEVLYSAEGSTEPPSRMEVKNSHTCRLRDLLPGHCYHIQVRTKPDGLSLDGLWGPWSPVVLAETPHLPEEIGLQCFTPDLRQLRCWWKWETTEPGPSQSILYWAEENSRNSRMQTWQKCEGKEEEIKPHYDRHNQTCTFQPSNTSYISVLVILSQGQQEVNYLKEPFQLHHVVLTAPPSILQVTVDRGVLKLEWAPPLEELAEHMVYQIQYAEQDISKWKTLQVQYSNSSEIHLAAGGHCCLQLRAQPDGQKFQGNWSVWSEHVCTDVPPDSGSTILNVTPALLLCAGLVLGLGCTFLSIHSSLKQKLWPPIPDLHHVLDGFLEDNGKHQVNAFFCNKTLEDTPLTCLLEVLSEIPLETRSSSPLLDSTQLHQTERDTQASSHLYYMVPSPSNPQGNNNENEYFSATDDGHDTLSLPLEHDLHITSELKVQLSIFTLFSTPLLAPDTKEERRWETSGDESVSATHISNQSYLLVG
ncbi:thrombopoietin receptor isoform X1 [Podarcis raffonei]|uniref:thrombopoietin receptor isoform X1 n=1 Tax=Podarcis raffonei TaxID=65483 RepID=UPI0023296E3F|nr:thrombopoietin receptor isoform X1 [Podarcis raffonei]